MANIFVEKELQEKFIAYLKQQGYPANRIVTDWGDGSFRVDIAIMADDLKTPLSIYEIKQAISINQAKAIVAKVSEYTKKQGLTIPIYVVFPDSNLKDQFEILNISDELLTPKYELSSDDLQNKATKKVLSYQTLQNGAESKLATQRQVKREKSIDKIKPICWGVVPVIGLILLLLDAFEKYVFNTERLIVLGIILIVVLLPFFSEISFGEVSVKRKKEDKEK